MRQSIRPAWRKLAGLATVLLILGLLGAEAEAKNKKKPLKPKQFTSFKQLQQMIAAKSVQAHFPVIKTGVLESTGLASGTDLASASLSFADVEHSDTNVQVQGVDEGDIVKTDGRFIYSIQSGQVRIIGARPAQQMTLAATLTFDDGYSPIELYVQGNRLLVIGQSWRADDSTGSKAEVFPGGVAKLGIWLPAGESLTTARIYNITNRTRPSLEREISFTGNYLSSRKLGDSIYLIGRTYPMYYLMALAANDGSKPAAKRDTLLPRVKDSAVNGGREQLLPLNGIYYFPDFVDPDYVVVAGFNLNEPGKPADFKSYLGAGDIVYASGSNLFLSAADYGGGDSNGQPTTPVTHIYKFALNGGATEFRQAGEVPGVPLNQFSLDEHDGYFRIATTVNQWTWNGDLSENRSWNNVYTLNDAMKLTGRLEHLAEGEQIYAARFMGDRAYLVTFAQTDPLFVIDLTAPKSPKLVGELKIPGFSNYLHPYDENHLIGIGQDVLPTGNDGFPMVRGVKLSLFDVTDASHPQETHSLVIGEQGTYSPALYDHKSILFDQKRRLLGFPIEETAKSEATTSDGWPAQVFQGAQIYEVSLEGGFKKKAAITHMDDDQFYDWYRYVQRLATIGNQLYTLSEARVQANDLTDFKETGHLDLPYEQPVDEPPAAVDPVACTMEVMLCPDGKTSVGRQGPSCEFAPCP
jgi:inhibitor of cysteine peptidase